MSCEGLLLSVKLALRSKYLVEGIVKSLNPEFFPLTVLAKLESINIKSFLFRFFQAIL